MKYTQLTGTGIFVSRACLGTMTFGSQLEETEAVKLTHLAIDQGVNFIDTAHGYTGGRSEEIVGVAIQGRRDDLIICTKAGGTYPGVNNRGLTRNQIIRSVETSLKRLNTDYIDIHYMHVPDPLTPTDEILEAYTNLIRNGKIRYIGVSNFAAWQVSELIHRSELRHYVAPVVSQMVYNILTRGLEQEFIPFLERYKLGLVVYNPLAGGMLTGKHRKGMPTENTRFSLTKVFDNYMERYWQEENFNAVEELSQMAEEMGISLAEFAMRFCISASAVQSVLIGFSKEAQLKQNLAIFEECAQLPKEALSVCDKVWANLSGHRFKYNR